MKRVIVTGATGFLGKNLLANLFGHGVEITAIVRDKGKLEGMQGERLTAVQAGMDDYAKMDKLVPHADYDVFYHFAWDGTFGTDRENYQVQMRNIKGACEAVTAAKKIGCRKFVYAGSLMEYESRKLMDEAGRVPVGNYIYRSAKLAAHYMAKAEAGRIGLAFVNMIISNTYGKGEISGRLVSTALQKCVKGEPAFYTAGTQMYDFIHVSDAAEAFYQIGEHGKAFCDYYVGSNRIRPLREYLEEMYASIPAGQTPEFGAVPYDGISLTYEEFDREALFRDTGFQCRVPFSEGVRDAYEWMRRNINAEV